MTCTLTMPVDILYKLSCRIYHRVTSRHFPYFVQDCQDATTNNSHCFTRRSRARPQCGFIGRSPYTVQHLYYNYSIYTTTTLLQFFYHSPTTTPIVLSHSPTTTPTVLSHSPTTTPTVLSHSPTTTPTVLSHSPPFS